MYYVSHITVEWVCLGRQPSLDEAHGKGATAGEDVPIKRRIALLEVTLPELGTEPLISTGGRLSFGRHRDKEWIGRSSLSSRRMKR
jgi:hypothetical protein